MGIRYQRVELPADTPRLIDFLCRDDWPFHHPARMSADDAASVAVDTTDVAGFWLVDGDDDIGLVRLLDMNDIGRGAPVLDVRIASRHRGRGHGTRATAWIASHLFADHPEAHRLEAYTRADNAAMRRAVTAAGFTEEGRLRRAWASDDGWHDAIVFGILRTDPLINPESSVIPRPT